MAQILQLLKTVARYYLKNDDGKVYEGYKQS